MEVIVELVSRSHKPIERQRISGERCTIGRAFDNDIILTEAHVSPHHAVLEEDELGQWWLIDCDSKNGLKNRRHRSLLSPVKVNSGDEFVLGKLRLKFYAPNHPVADALGLGLSENTIYTLSQPLRFSLFLLFSILLFTGYEYIQTFNELDLREFLPRVLATPLAGLLWAAIWAMAGRLFRHEPRFIAQCIVSFCYLLLMQLAEVLIQTVVFNTGSLWLSNVLLYLLYGGLLVILLSFNLRLATHQVRLGRMITANVLAWGLIATLWLFTVFSRPEFSNQPEYSGMLQPPVMRWRRSVTVDEFQQAADFIFEPAAD